jgi:hypothetical protein
MCDSSVRLELELCQIKGAQHGIHRPLSDERYLQVAELLALRRSKAEEEAVFLEMEQLRAQIGEASAPCDVAFSQEHSSEWF